MAGESRSKNETLWFASPQRCDFPTGGYRSLRSFVNTTQPLIRLSEARRSPPHHARNGRRGFDHETRIDEFLRIGSIAQRPSMKNTVPSAASQRLLLDCTVSRLNRAQIRDGIAGLYRS